MPTPSVVQSAVSATNHSSLAFATNVTAGNLLVALFKHEGGSVTISDTIGTAWSLAISTAGPSFVSVYYGIAPSSGANTLTFPPNFSCGVALMEIAGAQAVLDGTPAGAVAGATSPGSLTTAYANSIVLTGLGGFHPGTTWTAPVGWTMPAIGPYGTFAWLIEATPGTLSPTFTGTSTDSDTQVIVAFKSAASGIPGALPIIRGASALLYPFTATVVFSTGIGKWQNGAQQRWVRPPGGLVRFEFSYAAMTRAQKDDVKGSSLFGSAKGQFATNLNFSLNGVTYTNLSLESDEFRATESPTLQYSAPLKLSQTIGQNLAWGTPGQPYPTLANGAIAILPYTQKKRWQSVTTKMESGPKYSYAEFASGLTGYPTDGLMSWEFSMDHVSDADITTLVAHFVANYGMAFGFTFTDEDGAAYTKTHYAMDEMAVTYKGPNDASVKVLLEATN